MSQKNSKASIFLDLSKFKLTLWVKRPTVKNPVTCAFHATQIKSKSDCLTKYIDGNLFL